VLFYFKFNYSKQEGPEESAFVNLCAISAVISLEIRLDKFRTGVDIDLTEYGVAGINEAVRCVFWNHDDLAGFRLALFIPDTDRGAAFDNKCDFNVRMRVQRRALPRLRIDDVG